LTARRSAAIVQLVCNMRTPVADPRTISDLLSDKGLRLTAPRRAVVGVLVEHAAPLAVAEIHSRLKKQRTNLVSVYRTMRLLSELGVVRLADESKGIQRFELSEAFTGHHHHLVCQQCGRVQDLEGCWLGREMLETLNHRVQRAQRFRIVAHDLKLFGLCEHCNLS
jgi:Fur family ferric uptake transcriptional regulator